jgi:hypothetical protein
MAESSAAEHGGLLISRNWLAIFGTLVAVAMTLGNWAISQQTSRSTMSLQLAQLERRLDAAESRADARRNSFDQQWTAYGERYNNLSDRVSRLEVTVDGYGQPQQRERRSSFDLAPFCEDGAVRLERAGWTLPKRG